MLVNTNIDSANDANGVAPALANRAAELEHLIERHRRLLDYLGENAGGAPCAGADCPCRRVLRSTLMESIAILEGTRKSFKSRQLAELRQKLLRTLAEHT